MVPHGLDDKLIGRFIMGAASQGKYRNETGRCDVTAPATPSSLCSIKSKGRITDERDEYSAGRASPILSSFCAREVAGLANAGSHGSHVAFLPDSIVHALSPARPKSPDCPHHNSGAQSP